MRKLNFLLIFVLLLPFTIAASPTLNGTKFEWSEGSASTYFESTTTRTGGQTFTVGTITDVGYNVTLTGISFSIKRTSTPSILNFSIYNVDGSGLPTGSPISQNSTVNADDFDTSYAYYNIVMPRVTLVSGTKYAAVVGKTLANSVQYQASLNSYSGGVGIDNTGSWSALSEDMLFRAYGVPSTDYFFSECGLATVPYINFTFKDEGTGNPINASIYGSNVQYYPDGGSTTYTTYINKDNETLTHSFCGYPSDVNFNSLFYLTYDSGTYPQRIYQQLLNLSNVTTNKTLYLLSSTDGIYVTFQLINAADQPLENVYVQLNKSISGTQTIISTGYTGADGGITFWLNPDDQYRLYASLSPYPEYITTQAFTQNSYTISLGGSSGGNASDYSKGISYSFKPSNIQLQNGTSYKFNFTISSTNWTLSLFGFNITNEDGVLLSNNSNITAIGGITQRTVNTGSNRSFYVTYFYVINNVTTTGTRYYKVIDLSNNIYSIKRLFTDFTSYVSTGLFGLTDFGVGLIVFFIIVGSVGAARVKFGLSDETTLTGMLFALVLFFDVGIGLLPNPVGAIPNFPTVLMAIIFIGFAFKEATQ